MSIAKGWLLPLSGAFCASALATLVAFSIGPGCQTRCYTAFDCGEDAFCSNGRCETECYTHEDCRNPPDCVNPASCVPKGFYCNSTGRCVGPIGRQQGTGARRVTRVDVGGPIDGYDSDPGSGRTFIVDSIAIAEEGRGFDVDGKCRGTGDCIDNSLWQLGQLGNDQIRQGLLGGESLLLMELAGLDEPFRGNDKTLTLKVYGARDADDPFFPANNFQIPMGEDTCCEFKINPQSISGTPPQARARAPAKVERGQLKSLAPVPIQFTLTVGVPPHPEIRIERVLVSARVPANLRGMSEGLLGGAVPINTLAQTDNPYCKTLNALCPKPIADSTLIDLIASILEPDVDLDVPPDGLERLKDDDGDGRIDQCFDGTKDFSEGMRIPPYSPTEPWSCALRPAMADGYSIAITFSAVAATVVAVGQ